jgi:esterase/lipase superfamily enzyme
MVDAAQGELILFLHGFNTTFKGNMCNAGQLAYDLRDNGISRPIVSFEWASFGSLIKYGAPIGDLIGDRGRVRNAAPKLKDFLGKLAQQVCRECAPTRFL